jgi:hypothetical protein
VMSRFGSRMRSTCDRLVFGNTAMPSVYVSGTAQLHRSFAQKTRSG